MNDIFKKLVELETGPYSRWNVVPNLTTAALYSFTTQTIELSNIDSALYKEALQGNLLAARKVTTLLAHEVRHWIDHVASVWGQTLLCKGYNALHARIENNPFELWRVMSFQQALRDTRFKSYYTTIEATEPRSGALRWKFEMTAGSRFDHRGRLSEHQPIVFTKFAWHDGTPACRVPISPVSLLESSATHFEYEVEHGFISVLPSAQRGPAEEALQRRFLDLAYDPQWAEYSVAAHAIANFVRANNVPEAYELASILASISLNLAPQHFATLKVPDSFRPWGGRNDAFIKNLDRGFAFLVLAKHAPRVPVRDMDEWVEQTLHASGLPPVRTIKRDARTEMDKLTTDIVGGPFGKVFKVQLTEGRKLFDELGPTFRFKPVLERLKPFDIPLPPVVLGQDGTIVWNGTITKWNDSPIGPQIDEVMKVFRKCEEFAEACGF
jgi:hypothetical protein